MFDWIRLWHTRPFKFPAFTVYFQHLNNMVTPQKLLVKCIISGIFLKSGFPDQKKFYFIFFQTFSGVSREIYQQILVNDHLSILAVWWPCQLLNMMTGNLVHICFRPAKGNNQWYSFRTINEKLFLQIYLN